MAWKDKQKQKEYRKQHYLLNKDRHKEKSYQYRRIVRNYIVRIRIIVPCKDCGKNYHWTMMQFDHIKGKKIFNICSGPSQYGIDKVKDEITKCEIVCANCHAARTWKRKNKRKSYYKNWHPDWSPTSIDSVKHYNVLFTKIATPCRICRKNFPYYAMQFDHLRDKKFLLSRTGIANRSGDEVIFEMMKCQVLCTNCHQYITWNRRYRAKS